jgi:hypothetical protein
MDFVDARLRPSLDEAGEQVGEMELRAVSDMGRASGDELPDLLGGVAGENRPPRDHHSPRVWHQSLIILDAPFHNA